MNRLQKKCVIATVGIHLLLLTILIVGPAFYNPKPKINNTQVLEFIPANLIDAEFNRGVRHAAPPAPAPVTPPPRPAPPTRAVQPAPKPVVTPPSRHEAKVERISKPEPKPEPVKRAPERAETHRHQIQVNTQLVARTAQEKPAAKSKPDNSRRATQALNNAIQALRENLSPGTMVNVPDNNGAAYASYRDALATIYYRAWVTPNEAAADEADTIVKITVARDGTVLNARIVTPSGDEKTDASVRRALDRVSSVPPLPDQSKAQEEFTIRFNLKTKQMLE